MGKGASGAWTDARMRTAAQDHFNPLGEFLRSIAAVQLDDARARARAYRVDCGALGNRSAEAKAHVL